MTVALEAMAELRRLRERVPGVTGSLVATLDGLLIAHDSGNVEPTGVAALTAAGLGLCQRIAATARHGDLQEFVLHSSAGYVAAYTAGPRALVTVLAAPETNVGRLHIEARVVAERVAAIVEVLDVLDFAEAGQDVSAPQQDSLPRRRAK